MNLTENNIKKSEISVLLDFSERSFTLDLTGFELLALLSVSRKISGSGKARSVFSDNSDWDNKDNLYSKLVVVKGIEDALVVFEKNHDDFKGGNNVIRLKDKK